MFGIKSTVLSWSLFPSHMRLEHSEAVWEQGTALNKSDRFGRQERNTEWISAKLMS